MTVLYTKLARAYHEMYQSIFDYKSEYGFYNEILRRYDYHNILEIGCGSGNLAGYFGDGGYQYTGLDMSADMLEIAREINQGIGFLQGDMRNLGSIGEFDAVLITGRSFTYMSTNNDVLAALRSIYNNLKKGGILVFDNFDAREIFLNFKESFDNSYEAGKRKYRRVSRNSMNLETGWTWNWEATYYIQEDDKEEVIQDKSVLRAFTEEELAIFLEMCGFKVEEVIKDKIFAVVAQK